VGGVVLFCTTCLGLKPKDLKNPEFWAEITNPKWRRQAASMTDHFFNLRIRRDDIWHREEMVAQQVG
jgi:hypothetical protein